MIQFASASGIDEGVTSAVAESTLLEANDSTVTADNSLAAAVEAVETNATSDETPAPAISSAPVKEQLLNALRRQREAITNPNALKPTTPPGSLTIMNSPTVPPTAPSESIKLDNPVSLAQPSPELPTLTNQTDMTAEGNKPAMQPKSAKSYAGLTRTLEEDLKSDDAYLRERAQRFLRLEMQLLQLRSRQAAAAETATQMTVNNTGENSIPINPGDSGAKTQPLDSPQDLTSGSNDGSTDPNDSEQQPSDDSTSSQNANDPNALTSDQKIQPEENVDGETMSEENISEDSPKSSLEPSANATLLENVVVDGPIDRLGLANNLFAVGEYPLALEMYQQTTGLKLSLQQQFWVEYQLANCLRRLGNPAEASNRYRKLASQPEAGWLGQQAHWWVETLESIRILEKALKDHSVEQCREVISGVEGSGADVPRSPGIGEP